MIIKKHLIIHILLLMVPVHSYTFDKPQVLVGSSVFVSSLLYSFHAIVELNITIRPRTKRMLKKRIAASAVTGIFGISLALYGAHKKTKVSDEKNDNTYNKLGSTQSS